MTTNPQEILSRSLALAEKLGLEQQKPLQDLSKSLAKRCAKVTVLGDFKAGKSTLINRLFLKEPLLPTDFHECTAVPTRIMSGTPSLELFKRDAAGVETRVAAPSELSTRSLMSATTASAPAERERLAKSYSFAVLRKPAVLPENICLVDTPGLNTTSSTLMINTMWEAKDADALLYVVRAKQLALRETELLVSLCGMQSPQIPLFVVVTYDSSLSSGRAQFIAEQIQAQLHNSGIICSCGTMPLEQAEEGDGAPAAQGKSVLADLWDDSVPAPAAAPAAQEKIASGDLWDDSVPAPAAAPAPQEGAAPLADALRRFFADSVQTGRQGRIVRELKLLLAQMQMVVQAKLSVADKSAEDVARLHQELELQRYDYRTKVDQLLLNIKEKQQLFGRGAEHAIDRLVEDHLAQLQQTKALSDVVTLIKGWEESIPHHLKKEMELLSERLKLDVNAELHRFGETISLPMEGGVAVQYDPGFLAKVPVWVVVVTDYVLCEIVSPLPFFLDFALRFVCGSLNLSILPANIAAKMAKKVAETNLRNTAAQLKAEVHSRVEHSIANMAAELRAKLAAGDYFEAQERALQAAEGRQISEAEKLRLQQAEQALEEWTNALV